MTQDFESTARPPQGLLTAVLSNPDLHQQLGKLPADEQTISLVSDAGFSDPIWHSGDVGNAELETFESAPGAQKRNNRPVDKGFVPKRRVATLGDDRFKDSEYRIVGRLGSGGTGIVYQAHQRAIDREVALKVLRDELTYSELSRERFLTEARVIGALDHPNVIALHEVCVDEMGGLFYSMKRIDGTSWDIQIAEMAISDNVNILLRVADAIRYAHSRSLIHRDIKPANIMLGKFGEVLLADWGLAISHGSDELKLGSSYSVGGTPAYMAPELADGNQSTIGFQTDVYLLGAILFQILTGKPPHSGDTLLACIHAAANNQIRSTDVEGELMDIAMKAMTTDPADRYESVETFVAAIADQRQHENSERLVRRACERLALASDANQYEDFRVADALLMEALDAWPHNARAKQARKNLQLRFAKAATDRGDLDLAISIYQAAGESESEAALEVQAARKLREASHQKVSRYSALFTHSPEPGLLIQMSTSCVIEANQMFGCLLGYTEDEFVGRPLTELNLWASPDRRLELRSELQRTGAIDEFEAEFLHSDGHLIDVLISGRIVQVEGEEMVVATIRDISIRKKAEHELKKSRKRLCDLQRLAGLATWSFDVRTKQATWSEEAFQLAGRRVEDGVPSRDEYFEIIHPDDRAKLKETLDVALQSGAAYELMVRQRDAGGNYTKLLIRGQPILDENENIVEVYGVLIPQRPFGDVR